MNVIPGRGRKFHVYERCPFKLGRKRVYIIEETDWAPDENHRGGMATLWFLGRVCYGVGKFDPGLTEAEVEQIEKDAVWLDGISPGDIGRWRGSAKEKDFSELGRGYVVDRPPASEADGAASGDEYAGPDDLG